MSVLDVITGRKPFWKSTQRKGWIAEIEQDFEQLLNAKFKAHPFDHSQYITEGPKTPAVKELCTPFQLVGPGQFVICKNPSGSMRVLEVALQPVSDCSIQLFEGGTAPVSMILFIPSQQLSSIPGKIITADLEINILTSGAVFGEVRSIALPS